MPYAVPRRENQLTKVCTSYVVPAPILCDQVYQTVIPLLPWFDSIVSFYGIISTFIDYTVVGSASDDASHLSTELSMHSCRITYTVVDNLLGLPHLIHILPSTRLLKFYKPMPGR
jgi:hypothetical protein